MLLTGLQGCARPSVKPASTPAAIAVDTHTAPPAELLRCPERPAGFAADDWAVMPPSVRATLTEFARAFGANAAQLERLIQWEKGAPCGSPAPEAAR